MGNLQSYSVIVILFLLQYTSGFEVCCKNGDCYANKWPYNSTLLPPPICPEDMQPLFLMFTREYPEIPKEFDKSTVPSGFDGSKRTVMLVHGWMNDHTKGWLERTRLALLKREDCNVVVVGWGKGASVINYLEAISNTRVISREIHYVMKNLISKGSSKDRMWCVGHSLGAHVCGQAGKILKYARITGSDPAGPVWDDLHLTAGLTKNDADFVVAIHTHGQGLVPFGTMQPRGHIDFYPNAGDIQPGCWTYDVMDAVMQKKASRGVMNCSHSRAKEYFIESIAGPCMKATAKCTDHNNIPGSCSPCNGSSCPYMGYDTVSGDPSGLFTLKTSASEPWCLK